MPRATSLYRRPLCGPPRGLWVRREAKVTAWRRSRSPGRPGQLRRASPCSRPGLRPGPLRSLRLGSDYNHRWTAFGPANVRLHRVNVAVRLGDAGAAIDHARKVNLDLLPITERKASFFIDTAQAFAQWGKHEKAYQALRAADQLAPQEARFRPAVRHLVTDLLATAPPTVRLHLREFADHIGALA